MDKLKTSHSCQSSPLPKVGFFALKKHSFRKLFLKPVAAVLVLTFSYSQLLYAADVRQLLLDAKNSFDEPVTRRGGSPEELAGAQSAAQNKVDQMNAAQSLANNNPQFSLTTQNGDILSYINGKLSNVQRPDGTTLNGIDLNANGEIQTANLKLSDGSILIFKDGKVTGYLTPQGQSVEYNDAGKAGKVTDKDGLVTQYHYENNTLIYTDSTKIHVTYDSQGRIESILNKATNDLSKFTEGRLRTITKGTGEILGFSSYSENGKEGVRLTLYRDKLKKIHYFTWQGDKIQLGQTSTPKLVVSGPVIALQGNLPNPKEMLELAKAIKSFDFLRIAYDSNSQVQEIQRSGEKLYFKDGLLDKITDMQGNVKAEFDFETSDYLNLLHSTVIQNNTRSTYDETGRLSSVKVEDFTIHYKKDSGSIDWIGKEDGTTLKNLVFDASGTITKVTVVTPEGEERLYSKEVMGEDGHVVARSELTLISVQKEDLSRFEYGWLDNELRAIKLVTPEQFEYEFKYDNPTDIEAELALKPGQIPDALTATKMVFDSDLNLKRMIRQNNEILSFEDNELVALDDKIIRHNADKSYSVTDGAAETFYDANNNPIKAVIKEQGKEDLIVHYTYGKIRTITRGENGPAIFEYSYSLDSDSEEMTFIRDNEEKTLKTYKNGNLSEEFNENTSVKSFYTYYSNNEAFAGKVKQVTMTRLGKEITQYSYIYDLKSSGSEEDDLVIVTDGTGDEKIVRTYGRTLVSHAEYKEERLPGEAVTTMGLVGESSGGSIQSKLLFMEKEGRKFSYSYSQSSTELISGEVERGEEIVQEELIEKKLDNGDILFYEDGIVHKVALSKGGFIDRISSSDNGIDASIHLFNENQAETVARIEASVLNKIITSDGHEHLITYEKDAQNRNIALWLATEGMKIKYDLGGKILGFKVGDTPLYSYAPGSLDNISDSVLQKTKLIAGALDLISGKRGRLVLEKEALLADKALNESNYQRKRSLSSGAGSLQTVPYEYSDTYRAAHPELALPGNTNGFKPGTGGAPVNIDNDRITQAHGVWFYTAADYNSPKVFITLNQLAGYEPMPNIALYTPAKETIKSIYKYSRTDESGSAYYANTGANIIIDQPNLSLPPSYRSRVYNFGSWKKLPDQVYWRTTAQTYYPGSVQPNTPEHVWSGLSDDQWAYIALQLSSIQTGDPWQFSYQMSQYAYALPINYVPENTGIIYVYNSVSPRAEYPETLKIYYGLIVEEENLGRINNDLTQNEAAIQDNERQSTSLSVLSSELTATSADLDHSMGIESMPFLESFKRWTELLNESASSSEVVIQEYSSSGVLESQIKANRLTTIFESNRPYQVLDSEGTILMEYFYDELGNPTRINLKNARDTLPDELNNARLKIEEERSKNLLELATQKNLIYQNIKDKADADRRALESNLGMLRDALNNLEGTKVSGSKAKKQKSQQLDQIREYIRQQEENLRLVDKIEADSYAQLDSQTAELSAQIQNNSDLAFQQLSVQENNIKKEIIKQEISPIVYDQYRRILGRDPSSVEYNFWIGRVNFDIGYLPLREISDYLSSSQELVERQNFVSHVKLAVTDRIRQYVNAETEGRRQGIAAYYRIESTERIHLSNLDADSILSWLNSRSLHFGQSAFLSLEKLLDQKGITYDREELATRAILIDILTGVITPLDEGDLVISINALNKVAQMYGLDIAGARLEWEDLRVLFQNNPNTKVIAHINGNHFVIVTAMTEGSITYIDPGISKDKDNESLTISKKGFLEVWKGYVTLEREALESAALQPKEISAQKAMTIRGAFWGSILNLIGTVLNIVLPGAGIPFQLAAFAVSLASGDWISAIASIVNASFASVAQGAQAFRAAFEGFTNALGPLGSVIQGIATVVQGVGTVLTNVFQSVTGFFSGILGSFGSFLEGASTAANIARTAVSVGVNIGVSKGLEALGVGPELSGFLGSLAAGGVVGGMKPVDRSLAGIASAQARNIQASIQQTISIAEVGRLGLQLGLDAGFMNIIGLSLGAIQGNVISNPGTTIAQAFSKIKQELFLSLSQYGFDKLGAKIGLNPIITSILGVPLSNALAYQIFTPAYQPSTPIINTGNVEIDGIIVEDARTGRRISVPAERMSQWQATLTYVRQNLPDMISAGIQSYYASSPSIGGINPPPNIITEVPIPQGAMALDYQNPFTNQATKAYQINYGTNSYIIYDRASGFALKRVSNGLIEEGKFKYTAVMTDDGFSFNFTNPGALSEGVVSYYSEKGGKINFDVHEEIFNSVEIEKMADDIVLSPNAIQIGRTLFDGYIYFVSLGASIFVNDGLVQDRDGESFESRDLENSFIEYLLLNGIRSSRVPEGTPASYFDPRSYSSFAGSLNDVGVSRGTIDSVALFEDSLVVPDLVDMGYDAFIDVLTSNLLANKERKDVVEKFKSLTKSQATPFIPVGYSGGGQVLLDALAVPYEGTFFDPTAKYFNVETVILVGAPILRDYIDPYSKIKRIINIYSKDDILRPLIKTDFFGKNDVEVINIELEGGLSHTNYFFDPAQKDKLALLQAQYDELLNRTDFDSIAQRFNLNRQIIELKQEIEKTLYADAFIARLATAAKDLSRLELFLDQTSKLADGAYNANVIAWAKNNALIYEELKSKKGL